jgi:hypothetical protein
VAFQVRREFTTRLKQSLPWSLTDDQQRALKEITADMTAAERTAMETLARKEKTPRVKVAETKGKKVLSLDHPNQAYGHALLMKALATDDVDFPGEILAQLAIASVHDGKVYDRELNFMVAVVKGIQPRDQLETMLAVQMAAVHSLTMNMVCRLNASFLVPQLESGQ